MELTIDGIHNLLKYSSYAVIAWAIAWIISWGIFFVTMPFMVNVFGKVRGGSLNYALTWITMPIIIVALEYFRRKMMPAEEGIVEVEGVVEPEGSV